MSWGFDFPLTAEMFIRIPNREAVTFNSRGQRPRIVRHTCSRPQKVEHQSDPYRVDELCGLRRGQAANSAGPSTSVVRAAADYPR